MNKKRILLSLAALGWSSLGAAADFFVDSGTDGNFYITPLSTMQTSELIGGPISPIAWNRALMTTTTDRLVYGNNITVVTSGSSSMPGPFLSGVYSNFGYDIKVGNGLSITTSANAEADGIRSDPSNNQAAGTITIGNDLHVITQGASADGVNLSGESKVILGNNATIETKYAGATAFGKDGAHGIRTNHNSSVLVGDGLTIATYSTAGFLSLGGHGLYNQSYIFDSGIPYTTGASIVVGDAMSITTNGNQAYGVYSQAPTGVITIGKNSTIETKGNSSTGIYSIGSTIIDAGVKVTTTNAVGLYTSYSSNTLPLGFVGDQAYLEVKGGGTRRSNVTANGSALYAVGVNAGGKVIATDIDIVANGTTMNGVRISGSAGSLRSSTVNLANATVSANGDAVRMEGTGAPASKKLIFNLNGGSITSANNKGINLIGGQGEVVLDHAIVNSANSAIQFDIKALGDQMDVTARNGSQILNDVSTIGISDTKVGTLNLNLETGSYWRGAANSATASDLVGNQEILNLSLQASQWDVTAASNVSELNLLGNSTISFNVDDAVTPGNFVTVTVRDLNNQGSANNNFRIHTDLSQLKGSLLTVTGSSVGNYGLFVNNQGGTTVDPTQELQIIDTADGIATFNLKNNVEVGGYKYYLKQADNDPTNWNLYTKRELTPAAETSVNFLNAGYLLNYAEIQTLLQRLGDLRHVENTNGDAWVRTYTGKFDSFGDNQLSGFDMDYFGLQAGADKRLTVNNGDLYLGVMGGISQADPNYKSGDGDLKSYHLGVYGTYVMSNHFYIDGVLKYNHLKNKFNNVLDSQNNQINGDAKSDGYGISLEVGKRFYFDQSKSGYYIEPQAQLSYTHQGSASTTASNGLVTEMDSYDSTIGRISALIGYEVKEGANPVNVYLKTGYVTEMSGDVNYTLNGNKENNDFSGDWWENGVGITAQINKNHNLYLEGSYATGSRFDQMQINAGYRYLF